MPETALLINPSRRGRRRKARRNPSASTQLARMIGNVSVGKRRSKRGRRSYRRNPAAFGQLTLGHAGGAGIYGLGKNVIRRLYWNADKTAGERAVSVAKFNRHSPWIKAGLVGAGWLAMKNLRGQWSDAGEGMVLAGLADGAEMLFEGIGFTPEEKDEKKAQIEREKGLTGAGVLVNRGLASVLVEREKQLRAAGDADEELSELDPDDAGDAGEGDDLADDDDMY
jgi:hypothetical protein